MNVLALSSSPRMDRGNTELILAPFLDGMKKGGAHLELHYTEKLSIHPCHGDLDCMFRTPGTCVQDDDGNALAASARDADVIVFASPLYASGLTGTMKIVIDRLSALLTNPVFAIRDGHTFHPRRPGEKNHKLVVVSSCAMWEVEKFDPVLVQMQAIDRDMEIMEFAGALLRPHSEFLRAMVKMGRMGRGVLGAARRAGRELVATGQMSPDVLATVSRPLAPHRLFAKVANGYTRRKINAAPNSA